MMLSGGVELIIILVVFVGTVLTIVAKDLNISSTCHRIL